MIKIIAIIAFILPMTIIAKECLVTKATFDIGSGTTKMLVAQVNQCQKKVVSVLKEENRSVKYKADLLKNKDSFSDEILKEGFEALKELKSIAAYFSPKEYKAVATQAFRDAKNGKKFILKVKQELKINARIITQQEEAIIGQKSVEFFANKKLNEIVIWDIGGGSMQITIPNKKDTKGKDQVLLSQIASTTFKEMVIEVINNKNPAEINSPNPLNNEGVIKAKNLAKRLANVFLPENFKQNIQGRIFIGIGGVHYYSIKGQLNLQKDFFTKNDILEILLKKSTLTDKELNSSYAETEISNMALVLGFMEAMDIDQVWPANLSLTHGQLF